MVKAEEANGLALSSEQLDVLRRTVAAELTADEFALFGEVVRRTGLDPFAKQIYAIARGSGQYRKVTFQTGIDGYRLIAERTGEYEGQDEPEWCGEDGQWVDVWLKSTPPAAARVKVYRRGRRPSVGIALFKEYAQRDRDGNPLDMWRKMPTNQLAKCAEALAIRKAFANEVSGVYTSEEMEQAANEAPRDVTPRPQSRSEQIDAGRAALVATREAQAEAAAHKAAIQHDWIPDLLALMGPLGGGAALSVLFGDGTKVTPNNLRKYAADHGVPDAVAAQFLFQRFLEMTGARGDDGGDEELAPAPPEPVAYTEDGLPVDEDGVIIEGESRELPFSDPDDEPFEGDGFDPEGFRVAAVSMFDFLARTEGKPVGVNHAIKALGLKAKNVGEAWEKLSEWAAGIKGDKPVELLRKALVAYQMAE